MDSNSAPYSQQAEEGVVGGILLDHRWWSSCAAVVNSKDFYLIRNAWVWQAIADVIAQENIPDFVTVANRLRETGQLEKIGGTNYLTYLMTKAATAIYSEQYAHIVQRTATRRRVLELANSIAQQAYDENVDIATTLARVEQQLEDIANRHYLGMAEPESDSTAELFEYVQARQNGEPPNCIPTGIPALDDILIEGGISRPNLVLVAADTSGGKSLLMLNIALNIAERLLEEGSDEKVYIHSLEMTKREIKTRLMARLSGIPSGRFLRGNIQPHEQAQWQAAYDKMIQIDKYLIIEDKADATLEFSMTSIQSAHRDHNIAIAFIDYPGILDDSTLTDIGERHQRLGHIARRYFGLAQTLNIPIVAAVQQSRDNRGDDTGVKGIGESLAMAQHASGFWYLKNADDQDPYATTKQKMLVVGKQRNGPKGVVALTANETTQHIYQEQGTIPAYYQRNQPIPNYPFNDADELGEF